jgi:pimeloyl-ACP methyl ester carboxylesterase
MKLAMSAEIAGIRVTRRFIWLTPTKWMYVWVFEPDIPHPHPLVHEHGLCGAVLASIRLVVAYVHAGYTVVVPEMPGHGMSRTPLSLKSGTTMLADAIYSCTGGPFTQIGHSLGGIWGRDLALRYPELVHGHVVACSPEGVMGIDEILGGLRHIGGNVISSLIRATAESVAQGDLPMVTLGVAQMVYPLPRFIGVAPWVLQSMMRRLDGADHAIAARGTDVLRIWTEDDVVQPVRPHANDVVFPGGHCDPVVSWPCVRRTVAATLAMPHLAQAA